MKMNVKQITKDIIRLQICVSEVAEKELECILFITIDSSFSIPFPQHMSDGHKKDIRKELYAAINFF